MLSTIYYAFEQWFLQTKCLWHLAYSEMSSIIFQICKPSNILIMLTEVRTEIKTSMEGLDDTFFSELCSSPDRI